MTFTKYHVWVYKSTHMQCVQYTHTRISLYYVYTYKTTENNPVQEGHKKWHLGQIKGIE